MKKNVLITGTSTGVGFESALLFARKGYKVYATMRNLKKGEVLTQAAQSAGLDIELVALDVTQPETIRDAVNHVISQDGKIDVLVNNAGAGFAKTTEQASVDEVKWVTEVNYHGVVYCTQAVMPHMRKAKSGHIINVTSVGGLVGQPFNELYCGAKFAVEGYTEALACYVGSSFNIKFSLVEPGGITTEFMNSAVAATAIDGQLATGEYLPLFEKYLAGAQERAGNEELSLYQTGAQVAEVILEVAQNENPPLRTRTSPWAEEFTRLKTQADPDGNKLLAEVIEKFF